MAQSGRRLTARPVESERPGAEINLLSKATIFTKTAFFLLTKQKKSPSTTKEIDNLVYRQKTAAS
jgi:hypothetical protein